jgi:hypothetical protein
VSENDLFNYLRDDIKELRDEMREGFKAVANQFEKHNDILHRNTSSLEEHIRRTDLLENEVKTVIDRFEPIHTEHLERKAVKSNFRRNLKLIGALVGVCSGAIGLIITIRSLTK